MLTEQEMQRLFAYVADGVDEQAVLTKKLIAGVMLERDRLLRLESPLAEMLLERVQIVAAREEAVAPRLHILL